MILSSRSVWSWNRWQFTYSARLGTGSCEKDNNVNSFLTSRWWLFKLKSNDLKWIDYQLQLGVSGISLCPTKEGKPRVSLPVGRLIRHRSPWHEKILVVLINKTINLWSSCFLFVSQNWALRRRFGFQYFFSDFVFRIIYPMKETRYERQQTDQLNHFIEGNAF